MSSSVTYVIVGAGLAGAKAAESLRTHGVDGRIVLLGAEESPPYERPELSKGLLLGKKQHADLRVHEESWYADNEVDLELGAVVAELDRSARKVALADGRRIAYDKLLLTTGSVPRHLSCPGGETALHLRSITDAQQLLACLEPGKRLVVVGAGWIGLEAAAAARQRGLDVTVLEPQATPLHGVLGPQMGQHFALVHREQGVDLRLRTGVVEVAPDRVVTDRGDVLHTDLVLVGVGARPVTRLAEEAGLAVDDGVVVDELLRTFDPAVLAAGDVARAHHPGIGRHIRIEHWANALNQGLAAGASMAGGVSPTTGCPTSTPTSTTRGWSTPGTSSAAATTASSSEVTCAAESSSPSG